MVQMKRLKSQPRTIKPRAMTVADARAYSALSHTAIYKFAAHGKLKLIKNGRTTLIDVASLDALLESLPEAEITMPSLRVPAPATA